ncbi:MAG: gluconolactonase [Thermosipho sp. (in: Bacteria)]|nr:gluconolactonase [Thermosipho sp. (in: thermotogales)]
MKKYLALFLLLIILQVFSVPYKTYTKGLNNRIVQTQDAFVADKILEYDLFSPEDIYYDWQTGSLLIADTGNSRILIVKDGLVKSIGEDYLFNPKGVFALNGKIYVADSMLQSVVVYTYDGDIIMEITRPRSPLYGKNTFIPIKVAADYKGNIYVASLGLTEGLAIFNSKGEFLGFTASNKPNVSFKMILQRLFYREHQDTKLLKIKAPSPTNVFVDREGLVYTVTIGLNKGGIKKFNVIGENILPEFSTDSNLTDIYVDKNENIYVISSQGTVYVISKDGSLLFIFGGQSYIEERLGLSRNTQGITLDDKRNLYVLDKESGRIIVYKATKFGANVIDAVNLYNQGLYEKSKSLWEEILKSNEQFLFAYKALGRIYFKEKDYEKAFAFFKISQDKKGYSESFWQIRNEWLQKNAGNLLIILFFMYISYEIIKRLFGKKIKKFFENIGNRISKNVILSEFFYAWRVLKHPVDTFEDVHRYGRGNIWSAFILFVLIFIVNFSSTYITSPLFSRFDIEDVSILDIFINSYLILFIWIISNYLVSEISDGEGTLAKIFIGSMYAMIPIITFKLPLAIISRTLTLNESFIYNFANFIIVSWMLVLFFIKVHRIHNYNFGGTVKNILITIFAGILLTLLMFILYTLFVEEINFITYIFGELMLSVKS